MKYFIDSDLITIDFHDNLQFSTNIIDIHLVSPLINQLFH